MNYGIPNKRRLCQIRNVEYVRIFLRRNLCTYTLTHQSVKKFGYSQSKKEQVIAIRRKFNIKYLFTFLHILLIIMDTRGSKRMRDFFSEVTSDTEGIYFVNCDD